MLRQVLTFFAKPSQVHELQSLEALQGSHLSFPGRPTHTGVEPVHGFGWISYGHISR